jgi:hypothetical protein
MDTNKIDISILEAIKNSNEPVTAAEICKKVDLKHVQVYVYLKRIRHHIESGRSYTKGYKYGKKYNELNHQESFIYWHDR